MRLRLWSPLPPSPSGIADYVAEMLPELAERTELQVVVEDVAAVEPALRDLFQVRSPRDMAPADLDLYEVGNSPAHGYVYARALAVPGVVALHEWSLHHLVLHQTLEQGDPAAYLREMRRAHGETGTFVGRQVARALGGDLLPALFPLNDRLLDASLGVVALTASVSERAARRLPGRPVLHLPHHLALPFPVLPTREEARASLSLPPHALIVTAPGLATANKRLQPALRAAARLQALYPTLCFVVAGAEDPRFDVAAAAAGAGLAPERLVRSGRSSLDDFVRHLCAADVVLALRFPSHGEMSGALVRALGIGRPVLVSAGTPAAQEFPEGVVVPIDPGPQEEAEIEAFLALLLQDANLRARMGRVAKDHAATVHALPETVARLATFLGEVARQKDTLLASMGDRVPPDGLFGYFLEEVQWGARDLGVMGLPLDLGPLLRPLAGARG